MVGKIDGSLFNVGEHALKKEQRCQQCGSVVVIKYGKHGPFKACTAYPKCSYIESLYDAHIVKSLGLPCPECGDELVLRQGRFGMFIGCSSYPACQHIEKRDQRERAETEQEKITCPECQKGKLHEKLSRFGKTFYGCDAYPKCKFVVNQKPKKGRCEVCSYPLLLEKKRASAVINVCANKACQHKQEILNVPKEIAL